MQNPKKKHSRKRSFSAYAFPFAAFLLLIVLFLSFSGRLPAISAGSQEPSLEAVSSQLSLLLGPDSSVTSLEYLSSANLSSLSKSQPVIYANLTGPLYKAMVEKQGQSFLILYDFESDRLLRQFELRQVHLN